MKQPITIDTYPCLIQFDTWFKNAKVGDKFTYFIGTNLSTTIVGSVLQRLTFEYALKGKIYLFQVRHDDWSFKYVAVKASSAPPKNLIPLNYLAPMPA